MPRHSPFTSLCQQLARLAKPPRADLHVHTTASDGEYTPSQVVALARQAGLTAVAITDHDTLAGLPEAVETARSLPDPSVEVIPGVEITTTFDGRELHLLGYFVQTDDRELVAALDSICASRRERFRDYLAKLAAAGHIIPDDRARLVEAASASLGRRHVAALLVACGFARSQNEAFYRFLLPLRRSTLPNLMIPIADAIRLVHDAGGTASLAHPPPELDEEQFRRLRDAGLDAVEAEYAWGRSSPGNRLRGVAARFGFAVTGGSDCHGPHPAHRRIGSYTIPADGLERLRRPASTGVLPTATPCGCLPVGSSAEAIS